MEPTKTSKKGLFYLIFTLAASIGTAIFNFILLYRCCDVISVDGKHDALLYKTEAPVTVFAIVICLSAAVMISSLFTYRKHAPAARNDNSVPLVFWRAASGLSLILIFVMQFVMNTDDTPYAFVGSLALTDTSVHKIAICLAIPAAAYFFLQFFLKKGKSAGTVLSAVTGFCLVFFFCGEMLVAFNYEGVFLNSPLRVFAICAYSMLILFTLTDIRRVLPHRSIPAAFAALGMIAFFITFVSDLPKIILSFMASPGFSLGIDTFYDVLRLSVGVYALVGAVPTLLHASAKPAVNAGAQVAAPPTAPETPAPEAYAPEYETPEAYEPINETPADPDAGCKPIPEEKEGASDAQ